jgi:hypothetical protein
MYIFFWYNQVAVHKDDRYKTTFMTPWGTFMYDEMPFVLMIIWETFQRDMGIYFVDEKDRFIVVYLDNIIFYSKFDDEHLKHLR